MTSGRYERRELHLESFVDMRRVERRRIRHLTPQGQASVVRDVGDNLLISVERSVWAEKIQNETAEVEVSVDVPTSWWQHFKRDVFPVWLLRRFPVKTKTVSKKSTFTFRTVALLPEFKYEQPPGTGSACVIQTYMEKEFER